MVKNYRLSNSGELWSLKERYDALVIQFGLVTQTGAENIMKNVAKRILNQEAARGLLAWKLKWMESANREKGESRPCSVRV